MIIALNTYKIVVSAQVWNVFHRSDALHSIGGAFSVATTGAWAGASPGGGQADEGRADGAVSAASAAVAWSRFVGFVFPT